MMMVKCLICYDVLEYVSNLGDRIIVTKILSIADLKPMKTQHEASKMLNKITQMTEMTNSMPRTQMQIAYKGQQKEKGYKYTGLLKHAVF